MGKVINVQNAHIAKCTKKEAENGKITYEWDTPFYIEGLEKVTITPVTAKGEQYGDGILRTKKAKRTAYTLGVDINDIPVEYKRYMQGLTYTDGVETDDGDCSSAPIAFGCEHVKVDGSIEKIWFIYCEAEPIEEENSQSTTDISITSDTLALTAFKLSAYDNRAYVKINSGDSNVTEEMVKNFFVKVQTEKIISSTPTKAITESN